MCCIMGYTGHDLPAAEFKEYLLRTVSRGPDDQRVIEGPFGLMGFGRLAIMGLTPDGMQPFTRGADCVVCNGELYGFRFEKAILERAGYKFKSGSDCEILLPLYYEYGLDMFRHLDAEFALILYDSRKDRLIAARDPIGIRPLFYGYSKSEPPDRLCQRAAEPGGLVRGYPPLPPPAAITATGRFVRYEDIADVPAPHADGMEAVLRNIREKLIAGVEKRLDADAPVGFLLSGGLDSSLVCAIAARKLGRPIRTFAIGMDTRRHRPEIRPPDRRVPGQRAPRGHHHPGRRDPEPGRSGAHPRHLGHHHRPGQRGDVPAVQGHPPGHRRPGAADRRDLGRAVRLQVHRLRPPPPTPSSRRARSGCGSCICTTCSGPTGASRPTASRPASPLAIWTLSGTSWPSTPR